MTAESLTAQHQIDTARGNYVNTKSGILDGNNIRVQFYNFGEFADWFGRPTASFEWPAGSGHNYVDGTAFIVQASVKDRNGAVIHPLETNYNNYTRIDTPTAITYGWWPLYGYANQSQYIPSISSMPQNWPPHWPGKTSNWDGQWNGYFGKGVKTGLTETYYIMDDNSDRYYLPVFQPDSSDSTRGGLGIECTVRALQWNAPKAADILFVQYELLNKGTTQYDSMFTALYVDFSIGGHDNSSNNLAAVVPSMNLFVAYASDTVGLPFNWSPIGRLGLVILDSPDNQGMIGVTVFPVHYYDLNNDEHNWPAISHQGFSMSDISGVNAACFVASGPSSLKPNESKKFVCAYVFANDSMQLIQKANFARQFYASGLSDSLLTSVREQSHQPSSFSLYQNYPNPSNPSTTISYAIPTRSHVTLSVFNTLGQIVTELVNGEKDAGSYNVTLDATGLASGVYLYRMQAGGFVQTRKLVVMK